MYIIANKATFIVSEIINPITRKSKNFTINTTSLSDNKVLSSKVAAQSYLFSFPIVYKIS